MKLANRKRCGVEKLVGGNWIEMDLGPGVGAGKVVEGWGGERERCRGGRSGVAQTYIPA
jgi:hypothetical protein